MGTNRLIQFSAAGCYPASVVKNLVRWCQIFEVLHFAATKTLVFHMFEQHSALSH